MLPGSFLWTKKILKEYEPGSIFFLDGGVRKPKEAELFLGLLNEINDIKIKVIHLKIAKKESKKRLMERARSDDKPEIIEKRFKEHRRIIKKTLKIFKKHKENTDILKISGKGNTEEIFEKIKIKLNL